MKAVLLDGSREAGSPLDPLRQTLVAELGGLGWQVEALTLRELTIRHCLGCFGCWVQTPGECLIDDDGRDVARAFIGSDLVIYLTPVTFGGYSSQLKRALDRCICLILPFFTRIDGEVHHRPRYERYPRLWGVGQLDRPDAESERVFARLVTRNAINLYAPAHASTVVHGRNGGGEVGARLRADLQALLQTVEVGT
jgi:hypothetical protein